MAISVHVERYVMESDGQIGVLQSVRGTDFWLSRIISQASPNRPWRIADDAEKAEYGYRSIEKATYFSPAGDAILIMEDSDRDEIRFGKPPVAFLESIPLYLEPWGVE